MTLYQLLYVATLGLNLALGAMVWSANPGRRLNRRFLVFILIVASWQVCGWRILHAPDEATAERFIRLASVIVMFVPYQCRLLGLSILRPAESLGRALRGTAFFLAVSALLGSLPLAPGFIRSVSLEPALPGLPPIAEPVYGRLFTLYGIALIGIAFYLVLRWMKEIRSLAGIQRMELGYVALGATAGVFLGNTLGISVPLLTGSSRYMPFAHSLSVLALNAIIAYGITTRRMLDIAEFLRRILATLLVILYLFVLYGAVSRFSRWSFEAILTDAPPMLSHAVASVAVAFFVSTAYSWVNRLTGPLAVQKSGVEMRDAFDQVQRSLQTIAPIRDLLLQAAEILKRATHAEWTEIYLAENRSFVCRTPAPGRPPSPPLAADDPLVEAIAGPSGSLTIYEIERRPIAGQAGAARRMRELGAIVAVGLRAHQEFRGFVLFGPKASGRIYGGSEQEALRMLCSHLAVTIENARLYTRIQDQSRYLDNLLEHLVSGVVAVNGEGIVTVFNHEARRLTGRDASEALGRAAVFLPRPLDEMLAETLRNRKGMRDREVSLEAAGGGALPVRAATSLFFGHDGQPLGALLVFHDLRAIKELEEQVRRTDRLAGVGTLAAGMAHEIKNPLVTIKTHAQLLPERFDDPEFRASCSTLLEQEVERIDSLVNQLLRFARPRKPKLLPVRLHDLLEDSLHLLSQPALQKGIAMVRRFDAASDRIRGDAGLLVQMFLNFFLNAFDAMGSGGTLRVETADAFLPGPENDLWGAPVRRRAVAVAIRDTGRGIPEEDRARIFDPFFSRKAEGTGLGLSVAHGILREHRGRVEMRSEVDKGTDFVLIFPLSDESGEAPRAPEGTGS